MHWDVRGVISAPQEKEQLPRRGYVRNAQGQWFASPKSQTIELKMSFCSL